MIVEILPGNEIFAGRQRRNLSTDIRHYCAYL